MGPSLSSRAASCPRGSEDTQVPGGQAPAPRGPAGRGQQAARSTHEGERHRSRTGRPRVFRAPVSTRAQGSHVPRLHPEAAALGPGQCGGTRCFRGRGRNLGSFFRQDEHPRHQSRVGAGWRADQGRRRRAPAPQPAVPAQHHGQEEGRGGRAGASPRPSCGQRAPIRGSGAGSSSAYLSPSPRPGPGPSNKSSSEGVRGQKRERTPRSSRATQKSSVIQGLGRGARGAALASCRPGAGRGGRQGLGAGEGPRHCVLAFTSSL